MYSKREPRVIRRAISGALLGASLLVAAADAAPAMAVCAVEPAPQLVSVQARLGLGCAAAPPTTSWTAEQFFERGVMLWREDRRTIYVLSGDGRWQEYDDHFYEGQPERADLSPPLPWLREPIRGFGLVWRERLGGPHAPVGWATSDEQGLDATIQVFETGLALQNAAGRTFVLLRDRTWRRA